MSGVDAGDVADLMRVAFVAGYLRGGAYPERSPFVDAAAVEYQDWLTRKEDDDDEHGNGPGRESVAPEE